MRLFLALLFGTTLLLAAPVPKDKPKLKDEEAILGSWKIESFDTDGAPGGPPKDAIDGIRFVFEKDGKMKLTMSAMGKTMEQEAEYKLDPEAKLKTIDLTKMGQTAKGVYELDGDTFKLAMVENPNGERPTELKANAKTKTAYVVFKRDTEAKKEEKKDK
jgi:uncharacterized protein (TIGR03067 family)